MAAENQLERIKQALQRGQLSVQDEGGYSHSIFARCPSDGQPASVHMVERAAGTATITRVVFRCPGCGCRFDATPEEMTLR